jgi:triacylglycerol esterase/lipase EstA (alpha/beta hydrolase family)
MKNKYIVLIGFVSLLLNSKISSAQTAAPDTTTVKFADEQALSNELQKYGLKIREFPTNDPCLRDGPAKIGKEIFWTPGYPQDENPVIKFGVENSETLPTVTSDINIVWIHGLNGSTESWFIPAYATEFGIPGKFAARKAHSLRGEPSTDGNAQLYSESIGITAASSDVSNYCKDKLSTIQTPRDFIIAHSQGGIVGRELLRNMDQKPSPYTNLMHGLVTFGSPHAGAQILNQTRPNLGNKIPAFMDEACNSLSSAYLYEKVHGKLLTRLIISSDMVSKFNSTACKALSGTIIPFALDNYFRRTTEDFYVGAPFLTGYDVGNTHVEGLSEYSLKVPVVQFYGVEQEPVMWKFMSSTMGIGHDLLDNSQMAFGYDQDDQLELKVNDMIMDFDASYNYMKDVAEGYFEKKQLCVKTIIYSPLFFFYNFLEGKAIDERDAYYKAKVWLSNANEYYESELIGAKSYHTVATCRIIQDLICMDNRNPSNPAPTPYKTERTVYTNKSQCDPLPATVSYSNMQFKTENGLKLYGPCSGTQTVISSFTTIYDYKPNDGVVLSESSSSKIKVNTTGNNGVTQTIILMPSSNHDQMKNSIETNRALNNLYDGLYGKFFKLENR